MTTAAEDKKTQNYFKQIFPHINLLHTEMDKLHQEIYDNKKKCYVLKGSIQDSKNRLKEESNNIIKEIVGDIYNIRELYMSDSQGYGKIIEDINRDLEKNKEETSKIKKDMSNCARRINHCENEIGYHMLNNYNGTTGNGNQIVNDNGSVKNNNVSNIDNDKGRDGEREEEVEKTITQSSANNESEQVIEL